jgi:sugar transferase EpsL
LKRLADVILITLFLPLLIPIFILVAISVGYKLGAPVFFKQNRPGLKGELFEMIKFRSMKSGLDENCRHLPDEARLTLFGKFLRSTSLDELPELLNVLKGEMSLVGPRPLLEEYLSLYSAEQIRRHEVRPGITGWAQVNGRNAISWDEKFKLDVWYVENQSLWLDVKILFLTLKNVLLRYGVSPYNKEFMPRFDRRDE